MWVGIEVPVGVSIGSNTNSQLVLEYLLACQFEIPVET